MYIKSQRYRCPYCKLPSSTFKLLSASFFGHDNLNSNGYHCLFSEYQRYMLCLFCEEAFFVHSNEGELLPRKQGQPENSSVRYEEEVQLFALVYGKYDAFKIYKDKIFDCCSEYEFSIFGYYGITGDTKRSTWLPASWNRFLLKRLIKRRLKETWPSDFFNNYKGTETYFLINLEKLLSGKSVDVETLQGIDLHQKLFASIGATDGMRYTVLFKYIQAIEALAGEEKGPYLNDYGVALSEFIEKIEERLRRNELVEESDFLITAEFYRRVGKFDESISILSGATFENKDHRTMANEMILRAKKGIPDMFSLESSGN